jgi:hypothetical protein
MLHNLYFSKWVLSREPLFTNNILNLWNIAIKKKQAL